jgi:sarcosine/dimethylglycine N-methyltransferase
MNDAVDGESADIHFGGVYATNALAEKVSELGISRNWEVLDLCCGWGGATQHLAQQFSCRVKGIDINSKSIERAQMLVRGKEIEELISFQQADALDIPIEEGEVDLIWSQDAFCHIADHTRLLSECARVLRPGGHLVFTDFLRGEYLSSKELEVMSDYWFLPSLETLDSYKILLKESGFIVADAEDVGQEYILSGEIASIENGNPTFIQREVQASQDARNKIESFGIEQYLAGLELGKMFFYIAQGKLKIGRFVCSKQRMDES